MAILTSSAQTFTNLTKFLNTDNIYVGDSAPIPPTDKQIWFNTKNSISYQWDAILNKWIIVNDYTDKIKDAIENIDINSRNLLYDTASSADVVTNNIETKTVKLYELVSSIDYTRHIKGNTLTFAFDWEFIGKTPMGSFYIQTNGPQYTNLSNQIIVSNISYYGTEKLILTLDAIETFNSISMVATHNNGIIRISHARLLFGDKDLGWTQAPEDLVSKFETIFDRTAKGIYMQASGNDQTSLVNVNNEEVKIKSNNINIEGYTTINEHFKILPSGDLEAVNAKFTGTVDAFNIEGATIKGSVITTGKNFSVDSAGILTAKNGSFTGDISASNITGSTFTSANEKFRVLENGTVEAIDGNFKGSINAGSTITGTEIIGSTIKNGTNTFSVSSDGIITGASIKGGTIGIGNGTFYDAFTVDINGNVNIKKGSIDINNNFLVDYNGKVTASDLNITGGEISIGENFSVSNTGVLTASSAIFKGSVISGVDISGGSLDIGNGNFIVDHDGKITAKNAVISGIISMDSGSVPDHALSDKIITGAVNGTNALDGLNNLKIGGKNLITFSNKFNIGYGAVGITSVINTDETLSVTSTSGNENWFSGWVVDYGVTEEKLNEGDVFTISFTMKSNNTTSIPSVYIKSSMGYCAMQGTMSSDWSTIYCTSTWKKTDDISLHLGFSEIVGTIDIKNWKIEKGSKPTDWCPLLEETVSSVTTMYYLSTSSTTQEGGRWTITLPLITPNKFIWTKTIIKYASGNISETSPMLYQPEWIQDWGGTQTIISGTSILSPKIFAGTKEADETATGIAMGVDIFGSGPEFSGLAGYKNGIKTFHFKTDGTMLIGKDTTDNHISWNGSTLDIKGDIKGSNIEGSVFRSSTTENTEGYEGGTTTKSVTIQGATIYSSIEETGNAEYSEPYRTDSVTIRGGSIRLSNFTVTGMSNGSYAELDNNHLMIYGPVKVIDRPAILLNGYGFADEENVAEFNGNVKIYRSLDADLNARIGGGLNVGDIPTSNIVGGQNNTGTTSVSNLNSIWKSGFYDCNGGYNIPFSGWNWVIHAGHTSNNGGGSYNYGMQIAAQNTTNNFAIRTVNHLGSGAWNTLYHTGNKPYWDDIQSKPSVYHTGYKPSWDDIQSKPSVYHTGNKPYWSDIQSKPSVLTDWGSGSRLALSNWFYSTGNTGWYNETYGGGWYMIDSTWLRAYGNKGIYTSGNIRTDNEIHCHVIRNVDSPNNIDLYTGRSFTLNTESESGVWLEIRAYYSGSQGTEPTFKNARGNGWGYLGGSDMSFFRVYGAGGSVSNREKKYDIVKADIEEQYDNVKFLNIYNYRSVSDKKDEDTGEILETFKRQDLMLGCMVDELPLETVFYDNEDGDGKTVDMYSYTTMILGATKHLQMKVETLEKENEELKNKLDKLEELINGIVNRG